MVRCEACHPCPHPPNPTPTPDAASDGFHCLAKAPAARLETLWQGLGAAPAYTVLRRPEIGLVMVKGRISGSGAAFCAGEMTATRAAVRLDSGELGIGYVGGRAPRQAEIAAAIDALGQTQRVARRSWRPGSWRRSPPKPRRAGAWRQPAPPPPRSTSSPWHGRPGHEPAGERARSGPRRSRPRRATPVPRRARRLRPSRPHRRACRIRPPARAAQPGDRGVSPDPGRSRHAALAGAGIRRRRPCATSCASIPARRSWPGAADAAFAVLAHDTRCIARRLRHRHRPLSRPLGHPGDRGAGRSAAGTARRWRGPGIAGERAVAVRRAPARILAAMGRQPRAVSLRRRPRVHRRHRACWRCRAASLVEG